MVFFAICQMTVQRYYFFKKHTTFSEMKPANASRLNEFWIEIGGLCRGCLDIVSAFAR